MRKILVNYNFTPDKGWIGDDYLIYDRSDDGIDHLKDFDQSKIVRTENKGNVDYDKLSYLVENYDNLPEVFLWSKTNLFKYLEREEWEKVKDNKTFTPLLTQNHKTYSDHLGVLCYYEDGMYYERNTMLFEINSKYAKTYHEFAAILGLPSPDYLPFPPGGSFILTRETIHKQPKELYNQMKEMLPHNQLPAEAYWCERAYYSLWR